MNRHASNDADESTIDGGSPRAVASSPRESDSVEEYPETGSGPTTKSTSDSERSLRRASPSLSTSRVVASAAAAITASIITSGLTGYVNGVLIVGISAIVLAILSEVYSRTLKKIGRVSAHVARRTVTPILPEKVARPMDRRLAIAEADTQTLPRILAELSGDDAVANPISGDDAPFTDVNDPDPNESSPSASITDDSSMDKNTGPFNPGSGSGRLHRLREWMRGTSPVTRMILVFLVFALMSTGISWGVTAVMDRPEVTTVTNRITRTSVKSLSDADRREIVDEATSATETRISSLSSQIAAQKKTIAALTARITELESTIAAQGTEDNASPTTGSSSSSSSASSGETTDTEKELTSLTSQLASLQKQVDSMSTEITSLQKDLKTLQDDGSSSSSDSSSSTDGR